FFEVHYPLPWRGGGTTRRRARRRFAYAHRQIEGGGQCGSTSQANAMSTGPITYRGASAVQTDHANFKAATQGRNLQDAFNHALAGLPDDRVRYHMCWGSWHGPHTTDAPLHEIAPVILNIMAGAFSLEAANPRHEHEYHVWETIKLPEGKILIPGVIAHTTNCVEHPELVAERILRYARLVGRENVIAGVDCGFAQGLATARVHPSIMWEKFRMLAEGARLASRRLW